MNCESFRDGILDTLAGGAVDGEFESHRASCPACGLLLKSMARNERILSAASVPKAPADLWTRIAGALPEGRLVPFKLPGWTGLAAAAASALLAVALAFSGAPSDPGPRLDVVVVDVEPDARSAFSGLVPRYDGMDEATAMAVPEDF